MLLDDMNWVAVVLGAVIAFGLGMFWFSPMMFGKDWSEGSHGIEPPATAPVAAMAVQALGTLVLAAVIGMAWNAGQAGAAVLAPLAASLLVAGMDLFSQKTGRATLIDAGYIAAMGAIMVATQAVL